MDAVENTVFLKEDNISMEEYSLINATVNAGTPPMAMACISFYCSSSCLSFVSGSTAMSDLENLSSV